MTMDLHILKLDDNTVVVDDHICSKPWQLFQVPYRLLHYMLAARGSGRRVYSSLLLSHGVCTSGPGVLVRLFAFEIPMKRWGVPRVYTADSGGQMTRENKLGVATKAVADAV